MPNNWDSLRSWVDHVVDLRFGETVELHPWLEEAGGGGYSTEGGPDPARQVLVTIGIYVTPGASVVGEGGQVGGMTTQLVEEAVWLSINEDNIDPSKWHPYDRVFFPDRNEWFQITWVAPSGTHRPNVHLVRLKEDADQQQRRQQRRQQPRHTDAR